jgi:peptide-methionine (R)-S-oxide reductase
MADKIEKSDAEWAGTLTAEQFRIARQKGTERAFTGKYWDEHAAGVYKCVCCGEPLFDANTKFDSGSGWPSFFQPLDPNAVATDTDTTHGMRRVEVHCAKCGCHLGHLFPDGPQPTGMRYCVNSASLELDRK